MKELYKAGHCVRCGIEFESHVDFGEKVVNVCMNKTCPNRGLFAISKEMIEGAELKNNKLNK